MNEPIKKNIQDEPKKLTDEEHDEENELGGQMSFLEHLTELRERIIRILIALSITVLICLTFSNPLFYYLMIPVPGFVVTNSQKERLTELKSQLDKNEFETAEKKEEVLTQVQMLSIELNEREGAGTAVKIIQTSPIEYIFILFKVAIVSGIFLAFPYLFYEIWMFVSPGLYKREKKLLIPIILSSWACFVLGGLFCYFFVFRFGLEFLANFSPNFIGQYWNITDYINIFLRMILAFGIVFEEPVVIYLLARMGFVTSQFLREIRPYAIIGMFVFAAVITPPDFYSQLGCGLPLIFFYEISILIAQFLEKKEAEALE